MKLRVVSAILFSPRGGSAHVARALARGLRDLDWPVTLLAGSRGDADPTADAHRFYENVRAVDFAPALATDEPLRFEGPPGTAPIHPSFEERPGAPDAVFPSLDDLDYERQVRAWARELDRAGARDADVLHLHHLTPLNEAAARLALHVPIVGQLHGTELLMLERILAGAPPSWRYAERWAERLQQWAQRCSDIVAAPGGVERAIKLLNLTPERVHALPGGVDTEQFSPAEVDRGAFWQRVLIEEPRGWRPGQPPGSVSYSADDVIRLAHAPVLAYVGRFTAVKRLDLLIEAFGRAQRDGKCPASLVLIGGHAGEWEGEHPAEIASRLGAAGVFLAGWYGQEELPEFFAAVDAVVLASDREQFGQVLVEGMACGLPAIATQSLGPVSIVEDGETGWLVPPDDAAALAAAIIDAVDDRAERERRGGAARRAVCERFSWPAVTEQLADVLTHAVPGGRLVRA
jgi:glycosyltransferase involved in cell wall biosynthesis